MPLRKDGGLVGTNLVGGVTILDHSVGTNNDTVNVFVLEKRTKHGVADHARRDLESGQLERSQSRALVVRCSLGVISSVKMVFLEESGNDANSGTVTRRGQTSSVTHCHNFQAFLATAPLLPQPLSTQPAHLHVPLQILIVNISTDLLHSLDDVACCLVLSFRILQSGSDTVHSFTEVDGSRTG